MSKAKKYTSKGTGASDDVFFSGTKGTTATDKSPRKTSNIPGFAIQEYTTIPGIITTKATAAPSTYNLIYLLITMADFFIGIDDNIS